MRNTVSGRDARRKERMSKTLPENALIHKTHYRIVYIYFFVNSTSERLPFVSIIITGQVLGRVEEAEPAHLENVRGGIEEQRKGEESFFFFVFWKTAIPGIQEIQRGEGLRF